MQMRARDEPRQMDIGPRRLCCMAPGRLPDQGRLYITGTQRLSMADSWDLCADSTGVSRFFTSPVAVADIGTP